MSLLERVKGPRDLRGLSSRELGQLADEIRTFLISSVSRTGGHLGPNLGVVELTIALHRVFDSPHDPIIFDTGHQSYVHKILTGRQDDFVNLRQKDGLSGYPSRAESEHDWVENSHASTALSWASGLAKAFELRGEDRTVVAVVGDGALTGGMAWEALNNISVEHGLKLIIVVNDNGRSYTPTAGGLALHLQELRTDWRYEKTLDMIKRGVKSAPVLGGPIYDLMHGFKRGVKDVIVPTDLFADLGIKYLGPIPGHDIGQLERAFDAAKHFDGPVIVHTITEKGKGFDAAERNDEDRFHAVGRIDGVTGQPMGVSPRRTWTQAFSDFMVELGDENPALVAITAAMLYPTGLHAFAEAHPDRVFDVGIAEQHATTFAAGLARGGLHPVFAVYATFLNRAFDQLLMDVALHRLGVTFVLDRAGVTGPDGPSHNGMWDHSLAAIVPGLRLAAPRDEERLADALREAVAVDDAPTVIRFSKESLPEPLPAVGRHGSVDILTDAIDPTVLLVGYGQFAALAVQVADRVAAQGIPVRVADPLWALPISDDLVSLCAEHDVVVTLEDCGVAGGVGAQLTRTLEQRGVACRVHQVGIPQEFLDQGSRKEILADLGLTAQALARAVVELSVRGEDAAAQTERSGTKDVQA
ncbi:1-deoxy-D-xylulose-5-phosphate synthase [Nigerium massiliense]|uniref:1-deoxy-D-xylulose-5-phosphate synthase n=1 Tax=Nigerium massiliense TaxID=1522317 RepID=UPI00058ACB74|nr:1-deoxy-D-xylulose-5-phosphate synthase [Nigerium massiliense]